jgi:8-oxo-dGTP pyrophosphatase MutT (NUDIX family)
MDIKNPFNNTIDEKNIFNYTNTNIEKNDDMYDFSLINNDYMQQHNKKNSQYLDKANDKKMFCINCGKNGHNSKKCLCPIISIGIICIKINIDDIDLNTIINYSKKIQNKYLFSSDEINKLKKLKKKINNFCLNNNYNDIIEYLFIRRKNSLNYVEFIRGKYDINNLDYIERSINFITVEEKNMIQNNSFSYLWKNLWGEDISNNNTEFNESNEKFNNLKNGMFFKKNDITLFFTLDKLIKDSIFKFTEPEWGFPKGRRNMHEKNINCAKREFNEETGINENLYNILNMTPIEETYLATNNLKYRQIYYVAQIKNKDTELFIDDNNKNQNIEIGDIRWFKFNDALSIIRDYNIEKKNILLNLHLNIKYTIDNFKELLENF